MDKKSLLDDELLIPLASSVPSLFVVMGVTGSGKTTIGSLLAERAGLIFADADDYHPVANKQKMAAGHPLDDADRQPWLAALNGLLVHWFETRQGGVLACSALKESYRTTLAIGLPPNSVRFVVLDVAKDVIMERLQGRKHEFMNPALLDSQIATLEKPGSDHALLVINDHEPDAVVVEILARTAAQRAEQNDPEPMEQKAPQSA